MLRWFRFLRWAATWQAAVAGWVTALALSAFTAGLVRDVDRVTWASAGVMTLAASTRRTAAQMEAHRARHARLDRQVGAATSVLRKGYHDEGLGAYIPAGLEDDRARLPDGASVTELRPRVKPAHRQPRSRRLRP